MKVELVSDLKFNIKCDYRDLSLCGESPSEVSNWFDAMSCIVDGASSLAEQYRFGSFSPVREYEGARWFVNASSYYTALTSALKAAKHEIMITGWMITPELVLTRSGSCSFSEETGLTGPEVFSLDQILKEKAEEGVVVRVLMYREQEVAMANSSAYAEQVLTQAHPKIQVIRHSRGSMLGGFLYGAAAETWWSHHEKVVVIDQDVAFCGGLDLAWGRYDNSSHSLSGAAHEWPGKDFYNPRVKDFANLDKPWEDLIDRSSTPRMPWHDVHMAVCGEAAHDLSRHIGQSWNHNARTLVSNVRDHETFTFFVPVPRYAPSRPVRDVIKHWQHSELQILRSVSSWSMECDTEASVHAGYIHAIAQAKHFIYIEQQFFISQMGHKDRCTHVQNKVGMALYEKLHEAIKHDQDLETAALEREERASMLEESLPLAQEALARACSDYTKSRAEAKEAINVDISPLLPSRSSPEEPPPLQEGEAAAAAGAVQRPRKNSWGDMESSGFGLRRVPSARQYNADEVPMLPIT